MKEGEWMKRRITRLAVLLLTVVLLVSCTGCMDSVQLKSRTIIKMVGIDREEEQYLLTLLYFAPQAQACLLYTSCIDGDTSCTR